MPIVTDGAMMAPERGIHDLGASFGESIAAGAAEAWADSPLSQLMTGSAIAEASGEMPDMGRLNDPFRNGVDITEEVKPAVPRLDMIDAIDRVKKAGLDKQLTLPNQPDMPQAQLEIMIRNAKARAEREATVERGPQGFIPSALQVGTSFLVGAADPINLASAFIPIMGELRYGKLLAAAGDSVSARLATRAAVGAGQGAVGQAVLEPLDWWAHTQEGRDFGMADVLHNIMFGAALGGALQGGGGFISDAYRARQGRALYPFGPGEPLARVPDVGTHVPAAALSDDGISADHVEQHYRRIDPGDVISPQREIPTSAELDELIAKIERDLGPPSPEVATINDLPPRAHEDAMRVAISDLINGEPVRAGDVIAAAAQTDPRIAESMDVVTRRVEAPVARGRAAAHPDTWSLFELLAREGGLRPDPELQAIFGSAKSPFVPGFGSLVRQGGRTLDDALRLAKDHGYLFDETDVSGATPRLTPNDLLDRLAEENAGRRQYKLDQQHATKAEVKADLERERHEIMAALHDEIEAATGQKGVQVDPALEKRVVEIVQKEGESDVLAAYERAIMEDAERYEAISRERQQHPETAHIAGWDPDEPAGASTDGGAAAGQRGQSGLPDQGSGRADGGQPRAAGAGDRGTLPTELTKAADWRGVAVQRPDFNDPDVIAASNAAAKVEPPPAELDGRVTAATKAEAFSQRMYDMFAHRLPPEERARLDEALATLEREKADFDVVAQRGAACLFEGSQG
jgi:hypothetical protein